MEGSVDLPVTHFNLKENPSGPKQSGGSCKLWRNPSSFALLRATSTFCQGLAQSHIHLLSGPFSFPRVDTHPLFLPWPQLGLFSLAQGLGAL